MSLLLQWNYHVFAIAMELSCLCYCNGTIMSLLLLQWNYHVFDFATELSCLCYCNGTIMSLILLRCCAEIGVVCLSGYDVFTPPLR